MLLSLGPCLFLLFYSLCNIETCTYLWLQLRLTFVMRREQLTNMNARRAFFPCVFIAEWMIVQQSVQWSQLCAAYLVLSCLRVELNFGIFKNYWHVLRKIVSLYFHAKFKSCICSIFKCVFKTTQSVLVSSGDRVYQVQSFQTGRGLTGQ